MCFLLSLRLADRALEGSSVFIELEVERSFDPSMVGYGIVTVIFRDNEVFSDSEVCFMSLRADVVFVPPDLEVFRAIWFAKHVDSTLVQIDSAP